MSDTFITYDANATIPYQGQDYPYSLALNHANRHMDIHGQRTDDTHDQDFAIRAYYKVNGVDSQVNGLPLTIEDLVTLVTAKRAQALEREISPMSTIISRRNDKIKDLSVLLASVVMTQTKMESQEDNEHSENCTGLGYYLNLFFTQAELQEAKLWDEFVKNHLSLTDTCSSKRSDGIVAKANQIIKAKIDTLNNDAKSDLTRMDNLVSKRDEAFTQSSDLLKKISDGRSTTIKNLK